jgi:hypothetical protein
MLESHAALESAGVQRVAVRPAISIIHLVYKPYGFGVFDAFMSSYESRPSGRDHRLIILLKGFADEGETHEFRQRLNGHECICYRVASTGYDLGSYMQAVREHPSDYYGFFNSRSVLLGSDWLDKLYSTARYRSIGVAGATASYESKYTDYLRSRAGTPEPGRVHRGSLFRELERFWNFPPFPNCHIRTNAFVLRAETLQFLRSPALRTRRHAAKFENGRMGLTQQLMSLGLDPMVVDNEGNSYAPAQWPVSGTFWQGEQEGLLVADNQTERYATANPELRHALQTLAWGDANSPPVPSLETLLAPIVRARHGFAVARLRASQLTRMESSTSPPKGVDM